MQPTNDIPVEDIILPTPREACLEEARTARNWVVNGVQGAKFYRENGQREKAFGQLNMAADARIEYINSIKKANEYDG